MAVIVVTSDSFCRRPELRQKAEVAFKRHTLRFAGGGEHRLAGEDLVAALAGADAAIIGREVITAAVLDQLPKLRALSLYGVGYDNVDVEACRQRDVGFLVTHGVNARGVAEHTIGLMLSVLRNIAINDRLLHQGIWRKDGGHQLSGRSVAIIGCGAVGSEVARMLRAFDCDLLLTDIVTKSELAFAVQGREVAFTDALAAAEILTLHVPLTASTHYMIRDATLAQMRPGSVLINTSRGAVVSWLDVKKALQSGQLAGAGLDVFENEPMIDGSIATLPTLVATPHTAGNAAETVLAMGQAAIDQLVAFLK